MSRTGKIIVGLLSLVGVLAYNFTHTGGLLASYVEPRFVGYVAAFGIELAVVGLSLRIDELRRTQGQVAFHVLTLAAVVIVSALANIAEGYAVKFGEPLTSENIGLLDGVQVVVSLAATGLLSLVTFAIAEIVGHDIGASVPQHDAAQVDKPAQPDSNLSMSSASGAQAWKPANLTPDSHFQADDSGHDASQSRQNATSSGFDAETARAGVEDSRGAENADYQLDKPAAADVLLTFYHRNPDASMTQAAKHVAQVLDREYSREAVRQQLKRLEAQGKIERNGQVIVK